MFTCIFFFHLEYFWSSILICAYWIISKVFLQTLSGLKNHVFESVSDLIRELSFFINQSSLANIKIKNEGDKKSIQETEKTKFYLKNWWV